MSLPFSLSGFKSNKYNPSAGRDEPIVATKANHLCVLVHGLWGNPDHLWHLEQQLRLQYPKDELYILTATRNAGSFTYDGVEKGGERVTREIEDTLEELARQGQQIKKISMIGYSLGGLVARYAAGLLFSKGWFNRLEPVNFTTFASPHLGVRSPLLGLYSHGWNAIGPRTLSMSGRQLFLIDNFRETGRPLLSVMADPDSIFIRALSKFKHRSLYSNIINDRSVVFYSSMISRIDPFARMNEIKINYLPDYSPVILDAANMVSRKNEFEPVPAFRQRFVRGTTTTLQKIPTYLFLILFVPVGLILFVTNAVLQSVRSAKRIKLHEAGKAGIDSAAYKVRLMVDDVRRAAEDVFEEVNNSQEQDYLPDKPEELAKMPQSPVLQSKHVRSGSLEKAPVIDVEEVGEEDEPLLHCDQHPEFPLLALTKEQFEMIETLDEVGFKKYPVHIHSAKHAHAAIIVRMDKEEFREGRVVVKHWLERFEL